MSPEALGQLALFPRTEEDNERITGMVNGISFEGKNIGNIAYEVSLDGKALSGRDSKEAYLHLKDVILRRDGVNSKSIDAIHQEIEQSESYEQDVSDVRNRFWGGKTPEHNGFSLPADDEQREAA